MSSASSQRSQKREVMVMFEPNRMEPLVLQSAYRWVAPPVRKPLRHGLGPWGDTPGSPRAARERSAQ
jgi:hypothetical protein